MELGKNSGGQRVTVRQLQELQQVWQICRQQGAPAAWRVAAQRAHALARACASATGELAEAIGVISMLLAPAAQGRALSAHACALVNEYLDTALALLSEPAVAVAPAASEGDAARVRPLIYVLEANASLAQDLVQQVEHFGYDVAIATCFAELVELVERHAPQVVVMDVHLRETGLDTAAAARRLREAAGQRLPIVLSSEHGDVTSRLLAVRAGVDAYLVKPFDVHELIDQLDRLAWQRGQEPLQIIIVEDSPTQSTYYGALLRRAGMVTTIVSDPLRLLDVLHEKAADLILMDMYMPNCSGQELAKVVRQFPRYASIPIVYLSGETELGRQLDALSRGGDDFLTKPIDPAHLIRSVTIRAERARILRTFMLTDNLTGLLNHTRIKEQLHSEVARARRNGGRLAFAMLDIDHFKSINDTHGHQVGDRVIKTLARVLQQRLRSTDYIGRYGGEEFAVIMLDADEAKAVAILDEVRQTFGEIRQFAPGGGFRVTFSGGVATVPHCHDAVTLALAADQALYSAKKAGRNRIVAHTSVISN